MKNCSIVEGLLITAESPAQQALRMMSLSSTKVATPAVGTNVPCDNLPKWETENVINNNNNPSVSAGAVGIPPGRWGYQKLFPASGYFRNKSGQLQWGAEKAIQHHANWSRLTVFQPGNTSKHTSSYVLLHSHMFSFVPICFHTVPYNFIRFYTCSSVLTQFHVFSYILMHVHTFSCMFIHSHTFSCMFIHSHTFSCMFIHSHTFSYTIACLCLTLSFLAWNHVVHSLVERETLLKLRTAVSIINILQFNIEIK